MKRGGSYKRRLPAGIVDAGFASLATFATGLAAVNLFSDASRGVYAVYMIAFLVGTILPRSLIFTPAEVRAVAWPTDERLSLLPQSVRLGVGPALLGTMSVLVAIAITGSKTTSTITLALALTVGVSLVLSPIQDHMRRMLHIASRSWRAATVSIVQFASISISLGLMIALDVDTAWIPFGALTFANAMSLAYGGVSIRRLRSGPAPERLAFRSLASKGRWLVVQQSAPAVFGFIVAAVIVRLAGLEALGYTESARVVAQPVLVLASGLMAVLAPRSMKAGMDRDERTALKTSTAYLSIIGLGGLAYVAIAGWAWPINPMVHIVPSAYVVSGLVALTVVSNMANASILPQVNEMLGAHKEKALARITWTAGVVLLIGGFTAGFTGAYARAIGRTGQAVTRFLMQGITLRALYHNGSHTEEDHTSIEQTGEGHVS